MVEYFGENPKTTQPAMFFPIFGRFIKAYKVRMGRTDLDLFFFYVFLAGLVVDHSLKIDSAAGD